jgi:hypothetical protein
VADDSFFTYAPMEFHVSWGFPKLAKIALASVLLIILGVVGLVWFTIRWIRRRKGVNLLEVARRQKG